MQYTEKELSKLIEDVEKEFTTHLAKAEEEFNASKLAKSEEESAAPVVDGTETLAKAEDDKPADKPEEKKEEKEEPKSEEKPAAEAKEGEGDKPAAEAPAKEEGKEAAPAEEAAAPAADEGHGYDDEDLEHMHKMYSSMSKAELKAHHDAIKNCLDACGSVEKCGEESAPAPMAKSEETSVEVKAEVKAEEKPAEEVELLKSEISAKSAKVEELQKNLDVVTEFLTKLFAKKPAPAGKAITNLDAIQKSEGGKEEKTLTKSEITTILAKKAADPSLTKSDREAINAYYLNGASIDKISHLLK